MNNPILIVEDYWANSQLSLVRRTGSIVFNGKSYTIVNKHGITVFELSNPKSKHYVQGDKVIAPGEPCDLVMDEWIPIYQKVGRDKMIEFAKAGTSLREAKGFIKSNIKK